MDKLTITEAPINCGIGNAVDKWEHFTDDERYMLADCLRTQLDDKLRVLADAEDKGATLTPADFGIDVLNRLLESNGF